MVWMFSFLTSTLMLLGCGLNASISELNSSPLELNPISQSAQTDFVSAEVVTTDSGAVVRGSFGELSEAQVLANGVIIEGAFYE